MNKYLENLNRIEFVITLACTGRCKHCSEGDHKNVGESINKEVAANAVRKVCEKYSIQTLMTFGGEPLLCPETVYAIHTAAKECNIQKRQIITNGYFSKDIGKIRSVAERIIDVGINDILLSADAFHQETIPLEYVKEFAKALLDFGGSIRLNPAWLVSRTDTNKYNGITQKILEEFYALGITAEGGNIIFPSGNAKIYLKEYFTPENTVSDPYVEDPTDVRSLSFAPDGSVLNGNIYEQDIIDIIKSYTP